MARASTRVTDFNPQSQTVGSVWTNVPTVGGKGSVSGGSAPTPQAAIMKRGPASGGTSAPANAQKLRG